MAIELTTEIVTTTRVKRLRIDRIRIAGTKLDADGREVGQVAIVFDGAGIPAGLLSAAEAAALADVEAGAVVAIEKG